MPVKKRKIKITGKVKEEKKKRGRTPSRKNQEPFTLYIDKFNKDMLKGICKVTEDNNITMTSIINDIIRKYCASNKDIKILKYGKAIINGPAGQFTIDKEYED